jgi:hypothetical protein
VIGPWVGARQARGEMYRTWQRDLGTEVLKKASCIRMKLRAKGSVPDRDVEELEALAQRVALVFEASVKAPEWAGKMVDAARESNATEFENARQEFVRRASDDIRGRSRLQRWWDRRRR